MIATGGSIVSEPGTYDLLLSTCFTVWLKAAPEEHMARVVAQGDYRPMAGNREAMDDLRRILDGRAKLYAQADAHRRHRGTDRRREPRRARARGCRAPLTCPPGGFMSAVLQSADEPRTVVTYDTHPDAYAHWRLAFDGTSRRSR